VRRAAVIAAIAVGLFGLPGSGRAADDYNELIVGTWEIAYSDAKDVKVGTRFEFTKDGKLILTLKTDGKDTTIDAGGYKVEKDTVTLTGKDGDKNRKGRIALLNKSSLVINDEIDDKLLVLKKAK
jgi:uncharacterized protein (TIGR03066 family)